MTRRDLLTTLPATLPASAALTQAAAPGVKHVDFIHHSHTDVGYTDIPSVTREMQVRFLDAAIDCCVKDPRFRWTLEALVTVDDWWRQSPVARQNLLVSLIEKGQIDTMALPFNQTPFMDALQWDAAFRWLPADVLKRLKPSAGMQNDVNGFPRAGAMRLLDRGITRMIMGINADSGGPPFARPSAFYWEMPDHRKLFLYLGEHYGSGYSWFEPKTWQRGQARVGATSLRPPYAGDHLKTDEASLRAAHAHFLSKLKKLEESGYAHDRLIISYTNQWRYDNDGPFPPLAPFIAAWNQLGLQPALRFATTTQALADLEKSVAGRIPTKRGEFTDWWANGDASGPREVAASRVAKRYVHAALSPVFGPADAAVQARAHTLLKDLCLFDEHTWGANVSVSQPDSLDTLAQFNEKALLAYKPMGHAELLLGNRARRLCFGKPEGEYVINTAPLPYTGWVGFPGLDRKPVWVSDLGPRSVSILKPAAAVAERPKVTANDKGWPVAALWPGMKKSLFGPGLGDFLAVNVPPPGTRGKVAGIHNPKLTRAQIQQTRDEILRWVPAATGETQAEETPYTLIYTQPLLHPRLENATRRLELWRTQARALLTVTFNRLSWNHPELLYIRSAVPVAGQLPQLSCGGVPFVPYTDQLEGSCRDYYGFDGWAKYHAPEGDWLWTSRDAPLVAIGGPHPLELHNDPPADPENLWSMVFDNCWHTNFVADAHGKFEFVYDLAWAPGIAEPAAWFETMNSAPVVVAQSGLPVTPEFVNTLFRP